MEVLAIRSILIARVLAGTALAAVLMVNAIRQHNRMLRELEGPGSTDPGSPVESVDAKRGRLSRRERRCR